MASLALHLGLWPCILYDWQARFGAVTEDCMLLQASTKIADLIDRFSEMLARIAALCALALVVVQVGIVILRAAFGTGSIWMQESLFYIHAFMFLFAAAFALEANGHVRVDVFYAQAAPRTRALIDLGGALLLLLPFMAAILWLTWPYAARAWSIRESSHEAGGLPLVFALKTMLPLFAIHFALQGIAQALRAWSILSGPAKVRRS